MSAYGYKQTYEEVRQNVRFAPESGHSQAQEQLGFKSGHKWVSGFMSAYDPKRTFTDRSANKVRPWIRLTDSFRTWKHYRMSLIRIVLT